MKSANLADAAVMIAARGAAEYIRKHWHGLPPQSDLLPLLKEEVKAAIPQALDDAKQALEAHMTEAAEQTFAASMVIAGIAAAKAYIASQPPQKLIITL